MFSNTSLNAFDRAAALTNFSNTTYNVLRNMALQMSEDDFTIFTSLLEEFASNL